MKKQRGITMIEKLREYKITSRDGSFINVECNTKIINTLVRKINEIIDTIYDMQLAISNLDPDSEWYDGNHIADTSKKVDPYAEQRKWVGKLCRFWNEDTKPIFSILDHIQLYFSDAPFVDRFTTTHWQHCEPVKPDDDIIYKGVKDE